MAKKVLKLEPFCQAKTQKFTVEVYCHKGLRQVAPVKRVKGCWMDSHVVQGYSVLCAWDEQSNSFDFAPTLGLVFPSVVLQMDGIWVYGMEHVGMKSYYQVWHLLPEPNEFTEEENAKKRINRSGGASKTIPS